MKYLEAVKQAVAGCYSRYLLTTELYLIEAWERHIVHATLLILFLAFFYFNLTVVLGLVGIATSRLYPAEVLSSQGPSD